MRTVNEMLSDVRELYDDYDRRCESLKEAVRKKKDECTIIEKKMMEYDEVMSLLADVETLLMQKGGK